MSGNKCSYCGEMIKEMDFFARFPQGNACSLCIVANDLRLVDAHCGAASARARKSEGGRMRLLVLRGGQAEQAG